MKKNLKRAAALLMAASMAMSAAGCGKTQKQEEAKNSNGRETITWWVGLNSSTAQTVTNLGETPFAKALEEKFNVNIEFQHPAQGQDTEKFNIMIAMGNLPDIIEYDWNSYSGGPAKALEDGVIQELNLDDAPNLKSYVKSHDEVDKQIITDDKKYFGFPFIRGDRYLQTSAGIIVRKDWYLSFVSNNHGSP